MKDLAYQQKAIRQLSEKVIDLLNNDELRQKIVFKAPTGSGKTYMTAMTMEKIADKLSGESGNVYESVAFVWIAPNRLHSQAYESLNTLFAETRALNPIMFDGISDGQLHHGDVLCLNWGSIHSEDNILVRENESGKTLWDITEATRRIKTAIVAIIDEEHLHWDARADRAATVLARLKPLVEIRVSATPKTQSCHTVTICRKEVVQAQMIKDGIIINPDLVVKESQEVEDYLIDEALKKRDFLAECYKEMGKVINPLLLIQLPNDGATLSADDKTMRDQVVTYLKEKYDITTDNGLLAIWLSDKNDKINLEGIEKHDALPRVLLFKEAIAKGWDCPRASVLLIFRKLQSNEFAIQTLGRILRMPEQKYYFNPLLNKGYVYTNISKDRIVVAGESEDYWKQNIIRADRRKNLHNVSLPSVYESSPASDRNRLGSDFKQFLCDFIRRNWLNGAIQTLLFNVDENGNMVMTESLPGVGVNISDNRKTVETCVKIRFNVKGVTISIPKDLKIENEEREIKVDDSLEYTRSGDKIYKIFRDYCRSLLTKYEKSSSTSVLAGAIIDVMEMLFGLPEWETTKVILSVKPVNNNAKFTDILSRALNEYFHIVEQRKAKAKERSFQSWMWSVPETRFYNADNNSVCQYVDNHALLPYVQANRNSEQERNFVKFLEENTDSIDWWYKNGDNGRLNYAIEYFNPDVEAKRLFYVDFIIKLKNGDIYLFDTKGSENDGDFESEALLVAKHNALQDYVAKSKNPRLKTGSLIKHAGGSWRYCPHMISSVDTNDWVSFFPDQLI